MTELYISGLGMIPVLKNHGDNLMGVEIGVCRGENLRYIMEHCPNIKKAVGVDPWKQYPEMTQKMLDSFYENAVENLRDLVKAERVRVLREYSAKASLSFVDETLDFVYIDGEHTFKAVLEDLRCWYSKVKTGGIVSGHDYGMPAVKKALEEFLKEKGIVAEVKTVENSSWYFIKEA